MPNIEIEKETPFKKLSVAERTELATQVTSWYRTFHDHRQTQIDTAIRLQKYVQLNQANRNVENTWKSNIKENKIYTTWDSMKSIMWKEVWSNEGQMFDVVGTNEESEKLADKQKEAITYALKKMKAGEQYDLVMDYWGIWGDMIFKCDWQKKIKKIKRYDELKGFVELEIPVEENAHIEGINPMFFEFDVSRYKYGDKDSFDKCIKIYKRFMTLDEIKSNPLYTLTKEQEQELTSKEITTAIPEHLDEDVLAIQTQYGDLYEVLFLHGDFRFNGKEYKNVVVEVLAGEYLIFFDKNPIYINPFVYGYTERDEQTGRGISPLKCILEMSLTKEELINLAADIAQLNANPPCWSSDSFLKEKYRNGVIDYAPGKWLEYENTYSGEAPLPVKFDSTGIKEIVSLLANDISDASSINANAMGNIEQGRRTATEIQNAKNGADSRVAMKLDRVYQISLQVIENVAELLAMFKINPEIILLKDKGVKKEIEITSAIRQASYQYYYEDRNALQDRNSKFGQAFAIFKEAWQDPEVARRLNKIEIIRTGIENTGFDNIDKFFKEPSQVQEIANMVEQMPPQAQEMIAGQVMPIIQQVMQALKGQQNVR